MASLLYTGAGAGMGLLYLFVGATLSFLVLNEPLAGTYAAAPTVMIAGTLPVVPDTFAAGRS